MLHQSEYARFARLVGLFGGILFLTALSLGCRPSGDALPAEETPVETAPPIPGIIEYVPPETTPAIVVPPGQELYAELCASCHGTPPRDNLTGGGDNVTRSVIADGTGQMNGFSRTAGGTLGTKEISYLVDYLNATPAQPPSAPSYPHPKPSDNCTACHKDGAIGAPPLPLHNGFTDVTCAGCHNPVLKQAYAIPHSSNAALVCSTCHVSNGVAPLPVDHAKRSEELCTFCHAGWKGAPTPPHNSTTAEWSTCTKCHKTGASIPPPSSHDSGGWSNCLNTACHQGAEPY